MTDEIIKNANTLLKAVLSSGQTRNKIYEELKKGHFINPEITKQETFRNMVRHINIDKIVHDKHISLTLSSETLVILRIYSLLLKEDPCFEKKFFLLFDAEPWGEIEENFDFTELNTHKLESDNPIIQELRRIEKTLTEKVNYIKSREDDLENSFLRKEINECVRHQEIIENLENVQHTVSIEGRKENTNLSDIYEFLFYYSQFFFNPELINKQEILNTIWNRFCSEFKKYIPKEKLEKKVFRELQPHSNEEYKTYQVIYANYALFLILTDSISRNIKILKNLEKENVQTAKKLFSKRPGRPYSTGKKDSILKDLYQKEGNYSSQLSYLEEYLDKLNTLKNDYYNSLKEFNSLQNYKAEEKAAISHIYNINAIKGMENNFLNPLNFIAFSLEEIQQQWLNFEKKKNEILQENKEHRENFEFWNSFFLSKVIKENILILKMLLEISRQIIKQDNINSYSDNLSISDIDFNESTFYLFLDQQYKAKIDACIKNTETSLNDFSAQIKDDLYYYNGVYKKNIKSQKNPTPIQKKAVDYIFDFWNKKESNTGRNLVPIISLNPGAGKTFVGTLTIKKYKKSATQTGYILLVVPSGLINSWYEELESEGLFVKKIIQQTPEERKDFIKNEKFINGNIYITSYETLNIDIDYYTEKPRLLIFDELHAVTSFTSNQEIIPKLSDFNSGIPYIMGITGTPVQNSFMDHFNTYRFFYHKEWFNKEITDDMKNEVLKHLAYNEAYFFGETELPYEKKEILVPCVLSKEMQYNLEKMKRLSFSQKEIEQYALSPQSYADNPRFIESHIDTSLISDKTKFCLSYIKGMTDEEQIIIFSAYKAPLLFLEKKLKELDISVSTLIGEDSIEKAIDFTNPENKTRVLLTTLKKAGMGLNLQTANHMIVLDLWWNPATIEQALHRIDRKGQKASSITILIPLYYENILDTSKEDIYGIKKYYGIYDVDYQYYQNITNKINANNNFIDEVIRVRKEKLAANFKDDIYGKNLIHFGKKKIISKSLEVPLISNYSKENAYTIIQEHRKHLKDFAPSFYYSMTNCFTPVERKTIGEESIQNYKEELYSEVENNYSKDS